ncbi:dipeptide transport system permease protein DppC [Cutibacterium acnes JCM 18909]|nr:dipeptide transport system permease protein DppC [Cutibacterium acnes JCM 18909]
MADPTPGENDVLGNSKPRSVWNDAWDSLERNPLFWISVTLIVVFLVMAAVPAIFTSKDPTDCNLSAARHIPSAVHWFGTDIQGCDVYSRTVYGARSSILVGVLATLGTTILGAFIGLVAGFRGGWLDTLLSRTGDVFYAIPLLLGGIIILYTFPNEPGTPYLVMVLKVVGAIIILGWPSIARLMRSSVLQVLPHDYVQAARALGASSWRIIRSHILPNAVTPVIVVATINLGAYIAIEATLSYLASACRNQPSHEVCRFLTPPGWDTSAQHRSCCFSRHYSCLWRCWHSSSLARRHRTPSTPNSTEVSTWHERHSRALVFTWNRLTGCSLKSTTCTWSSAPVTG